MFQYLSTLDSLLTYIVIISGAFVLLGTAGAVIYKIVTAERIKAGPIEIEAEESKEIAIPEPEVKDEPKKRNKK